MNATEFSKKFDALINEAAAPGGMQLGEIVSIIEITKIILVTEQIAAMKSAAIMQVAQQMSAEAPKIITPN